MYAVITSIRLKPDRIDDVREVYRRTTPDLVASQEDWVSAIFTANRPQDTITVVARWTNAESYERFKASEEYSEVMGELARYFAHPPTVEINEILVEL